MEDLRFYMEESFKLTAEINEDHSYISCRTIETALHCDASWLSPIVDLDDFELEKTNL